MSQLEWTDHTVSYDDSSGRRVVLDFANRQQREIDERARTVTIKPLQALVSFRATEARNRGEHIYSVMKAGGLPDNDFAPILAEHQLAVSLPASQRVLGKLGHLTPMHVGGEVTVRVVEPAATPRSPLLDGFEERLPLDGSEPIDAVLRINRGTTPPSIATRCSEALGLLQGATPLLGVLTFLEITLEQPVEMPPAIAAAIKSSTDEVVPSFLALLQPPPEVDARAVLRVFESLRGRAGRMAYLLGAFEAPVHLVLNQRNEAREALTKVVEANPRVTGAWKDLGDLFCPTYDFTRAWLCWERARSIAPTHPVLEDVASFERKLEADHPEYFRIV